MGAFKDADLPRAPSLALLAKEFEIHAFRRHSRRADGHEFSLGARAGGVDQSCCGFLSRAGRTRNQHPAVCRSHARNHRPQLLSGRRRADHPIWQHGLCPKMPIFTAKVRRLQRAFDQQEKAIRLERFFKKIVGAALDRTHRCLDVSVSGNHNHRKVGIQILDDIEQFKPVEPATLHPDIKDHEGRLPGADRPQR